jgi:hypothetical protein
MKSVASLISYLHEFFWIFSQLQTIYFELFSTGSKFNSENADERDPLSAAAVRAEPAWQRAVAACLPRAVPLSRLKCAVGTARRHPDSAVPTGCPKTSSPRCRRRLACLDNAILTTAVRPRAHPVRSYLLVHVRCPSLSGRLRRRDHAHGERRPSPPLTVSLSWSAELTSLSLLPVVGPPPATGALISSEKRRRRAGFLPLPVDEELR